MPIVLKRLEISVEVRDFLKASIRVSVKPASFKAFMRDKSIWALIKKARSSLLRVPEAASDIHSLSLAVLSMKADPAFFNSASLT